MIHTITTYGPPAPDSWRLPKERHLFGYYETRTQARHAVLTNYADMHENLFTHIVIEAVEPGVHGECSEEEWFEWTFDREWFPCAPPAWVEGVSQHAMG